MSGVTRRGALRFLALVGVPLVAVPILAGTCNRATHVTDWGTGMFEKGKENRDDAPPFDSLGGPFQPPQTSEPDPNRPTPIAPFDIDGRIDPAALKAYLDGLVFDYSLSRSDFALFPCRKPQNVKKCPGGDIGVMAYIQPEAGAHLRSVSALQDGEGFVVARIINYSADEDDALGAPGHRRIWWFLYRKNRQLYTRLFYRNYGDPANPIAFVRKHGEKPLKECPGATTVRGRPAIARWGDCAAYGHFSGASARRQTAFRGLPLRWFAPRELLAAPPQLDNLLTGDSWITCDPLGCCTRG